MEHNQEIENIYLKIFEYGKTNQLGLYLEAAKIAYESKGYRLKFFKEITQQLVNTRKNMIEYFGEEIINDIDNLSLKVRKIRKYEAKVPKQQKHLQF